MKKKMLPLAAALSALVGLSACANDDDKTASDHSDAWADAFIKKWGSGASTKWGINAYAGGEGLTAASVKSPDDHTYTLAEYWKGPGNLRYHAQATDANTATSYAGFKFGEWTFTLTFSDGTTKTVTDTIAEPDGDITTNHSVTQSHTEGESSVTIKFTQSNDAQRYNIQLVTQNAEEDKPYYVCQFTAWHSDFTESTGSGYVINTSDMNGLNANATCGPESGFKNKAALVAGASYFAQVAAVRFENSVMSGTFDYTTASRNRHMVFPAKKGTNGTTGATW